MRKAILFSIVAVVSLLWASQTWAKPVQYSGTGHWYEAFVFTDADPTPNWDQAKANAEKMGGYLATITSEGENDFIYNLIDEDKFWFHSGEPGDHYTQGPWIGGYQETSATSLTEGWKWVNGDPWSFTNWADGEPNDWRSGEWPPVENGDQNYLHFFNNQYYPPSPKWAKTWEDIAIDNWGRTRGYVVEWDTEPVPEVTAPTYFPVKGKKGKISIIPLE